MKDQKLSVRKDRIELSGDVGECTVRLDSGSSVEVHRKGYTPLAITGLTVTPFPCEENWGALIALEQGKAAPMLQVSVHQLQRRRVWPTLIFADHAVVTISAPGLRTAIELRFLWEAVAP